MQESKVKANEKIEEYVTKLDESRDSVVKLSLEKKNLENKLIIKEKVCRLLREMLEEDDKPYNQDLQEKIERKRKKIKILEEELQSKEDELKSVLQDVQTKQQKLSNCRKELKKQHKKVMQLQREKERLACSCNIQKERVSKLLQIMLALPEEMKVIFWSNRNQPRSIILDQLISVLQLVVSQFTNTQFQQTPIYIGNNSLLL